MTDQIRSHTPQKTGSTPRRTLLRGVAWTAPALTVAHAAPAFAASCDDESFTLSLPDGGLSDVDGTEVEFPVPPGVTSIEFEVLGGAGGGRSATLIGGAGTLVKGTLQVTEGETLKLIVGQGGAGNTAAQVGGAADSGGKGHGNGGDAVLPRRQDNNAVADHYFAGASGGAGSAILRGTAALVIAGGGGGAGSAILEPAAAGSTYHQRPVGGSGDSDGSRGEISTTNPTSRLVAPGGSGASSTAPGSGGAQPNQPVPDNNFDNSMRRAGSTGTHTANRGNGGTPGGAAGHITGGAAWGASGGAGGGGYAGGGGGSAIAVYYGMHSVPGLEGSSHRALGVGSAGGGGSSFTLSSAVTNPQTTVGDNANSAPNVRKPGKIVLRWKECH